MSHKYRQIARERSYRNRFSATHHGVLGDPDRIDMDGVLGEAAFAEEFGIPEKKIRRKRPVSSNFELRDGTRVDVRASRAKYARLIVPPKVAKRKLIDAYVLAEISQDGKSVKLRGWATREEVLAAPVTTISQLHGAEPVHVINQYQLREMETLRMRHIPTMRPMFDLESL